MHMRKIFYAAAVLLALPVAPAIAQDAGNAEQGEKVFRKCRACHRVGEGAKNAVGPLLNGVVGRTAGSVEDYRYSKLNHAAGEAGLTWTEEHIFDYLADPNGFLTTYLKDAGKEASGRTRMTFRLRDEQERRDVIAYLKTFAEEKAK